MKSTGILNAAVQRALKRTQLASLLLLTGLWMMADTFLPQPLTYFSFRAIFVQFTGVLAMGVMSIAMLLALRPVILEPYLNRQDLIANGLAEERFHQELFEMR